MQEFSRVLFLTVGMLFGLATGAAAEICNAPDNVAIVSGAVHCLAIKTYMPDADTRTLVIVLHGDLSSGGPADYIFPIARRAAEFGAVGVAMMRPGYIGDGRQSSGVATRNQNRPDMYRGDEIDSMATAVAALKTHHAATRVMVVGHSGGAAIAGVMVGRSAPLVDAVVLVSCPCDVVRWRAERRRKPFENAESPIRYLSSVPKTATIFALTGDGDRNTFPRLGRDYVAAAKALGLSATFVEVPDAGHGFGRLSRQPHIFDALKIAIFGN